MTKQDEVWNFIKDNYNVGDTFSTRDLIDKFGESVSGILDKLRIKGYLENYPLKGSDKQHPAQRTWRRLV